MGRTFSIQTTRSYTFCVFQDMTMQCLWIVLALSITAADAFSCHNSGVFPDPDRCDLYHMCHAGLIHEPITCDKGYLYDASRELCNIASRVTCHIRGGRDKRSDRTENNLIEFLMQKLRDNHVDISQ